MSRNQTVEGLAERALRPADAERLVALSAEAGWNQTPEDWRLLLEVGEGWGLWEDGSPVASAMILPYDSRFAWVNMVLVTGRFRRRGIGRRLLMRCMETLSRRHLAAVLDATPDGRNVYLPLGFRDLWGLKRYRSEVPRVEAGCAPAGIRPVRREDIASVAAYDRAMFGADRSEILAHLLARCGDRAFLAEADGRVTGFVMARGGRLALHLGPLGADDESTAIALAARALEVPAEQVFVDTADRHSGFVAWLLRTGFRAERSFMRMCDRPEAMIGDPTRLYAAAGPELG